MFCLIPGYAFVLFIPFPHHGKHALRTGFQWLYSGAPPLATIAAIPMVSNKKHAAVLSVDNHIICKPDHTKQFVNDTIRVRF